MAKILVRLGAGLLALTSLATQAQELQTYVQRCQNELQFRAEEVPALVCKNGVNFADFRPTAVNDYLVYHRVNDNVDLTAACRWGNFRSSPANAFFASLELFIHNRQTGGTCYFAAKEQASGVDDRKVSGNIVSPTSFPAANNYWLTPTQLNAKTLPSTGPDIHGPPVTTEPVRCVNCHAAGPYVASDQIAPTLALYGLLNNGHDTHVNMDGTNYYHAVGSEHYSNPHTRNHAFGMWNSIIRGNNDNGSDCSTGCHVVARNSTIGTLSMPFDSATLLQSIQHVIWYLESTGKMYPTDPASPYRWINRDQPGDGDDVETFTASKIRFPIAQYGCGNPTNLEAHAVGSDVNFTTSELASLPDKVRTFNLRDGLTCLNSDQQNGRRCFDYQVSYRCNTRAVTWTPFYNKDIVGTDDGDREDRSKSIAEATTFCGHTPVGIRAQALVNGSPTTAVNGPNDRLAQLIPPGLVCRNSEQGANQRCSNYVVRFGGCQTPKLARIRNAWVNPPTFTDRLLTATNNVDGAETRAQANNFQYPSQDWYIEPVAGGDTVRLRDVWSGKYLTASSNSDMASVVVRNLDAGLTRQQWFKEVYATSGPLAIEEVRFRNLGTGRYLTVGNYTGSDPYFAPVISQSYSNQNWASQRWFVQ
jgi:hypothetical protein